MIGPGAWLAILATSWALFGLIWTIQLVHYPSFRYVPDFSEFHRHHTTSISLIVAPLMVAELAVTAWVSYRSSFAWTWVVPLVIVLVIWALTFFRAIPLHKSLAARRDNGVIEALVLINWPRTLLWTVKAAWVSALFVISMQGS